MLNRAQGPLAMRLGTLCDHALIGQDGKLSLIGIFDRIGVMQIPAQHPRFFVVAVLTGDAHGTNIEMELAAPNGRTLMQEKINIDPDAIAAGSGNLLAEINMLPLEMTGRYEFRLRGNNQLLGVISLTVDQVEVDEPDNITPLARA